MTPNPHHAIPAALLTPESVEAHSTAYGHDLPDGARTIRTIMGRWDDAAKTSIRAASLETESPETLADGRLCIHNGLWTPEIIHALDEGQLPEGVERLTPEAYADLRIPEEEIEEEGLLAAAWHAVKDWWLS